MYPTYHYEVCKKNYFTDTPNDSGHWKHTTGS